MEDISLFHATPRGSETMSRVTNSRKDSACEGCNGLDVHEVTRYVPQPIQCMLWGKAAGRCEFAGCNKPLWKSSVTQEQVNIAQKAHIYSFSRSGPRGNEGLAPEEINGIGNLMLVCHECHQKLDAKQNGDRYNAELLQEWKDAHEDRVELVTGIAASKKSHILLYGANVGDHNAPLSYRDAAAALFPTRYPASDAPIEVSTVNSSFVDKDAEFWTVEAKNLFRKFERSVRERLATGAIDHLSIFSLAPQPLLILLGTMLGDIVPCDVYQRHREPCTWEWPTATPEAPAFEIERPENTSGPPALVLALSGTVSIDRIASVLGDEVHLWTITVPTPHNDLIKTRAQLTEFRSMMRLVLDEIKTIHGQRTSLHVFPVAAVSVAIEFGRVRMPKADMPWRVYDQINACGGFVAALDIPYGEN
jgi:hypothetical protein